MNSQNKSLVRIASYLLPYMQGIESLDLCNDEKLENLIVDALQQVERKVLSLQRQNKKLFSKVESLSQTSFPFYKN